MLPLGKLLVVIGLYVAFLAWARLLPAGRPAALAPEMGAADPVRRGLVAGLVGARVLVSLRVVLLSGAFAIVFATTTPEEFRLALEWLRLPYRYAFSLSLAVQSIGLLEAEWRAVMEAQQARGAWTPLPGWRNLTRQARDLVALAVPAVVMTTRRAWAMTEAAYARGFDSPGRRPYRRLRMGRLDWALLLGAALVVTALVLWR